MGVDGPGFGEMGCLVGPRRSAAATMEGTADGRGWDSWISDRILTDERNGRTRRLLDGSNGGCCEFGSNDSLGLSVHSEVKCKTIETIQDRGMGSRGSVLVCGYTDLHASLEERLCRLTRSERCLLFPTGYSANLAVVSSLGVSGCHVFSDAYNHASIVDACRLAKQNGAKVSIYRHNDVLQLDAMLEECTCSRKLVVSDSLFSMDGDFADLRGLANLKKKHGFWLAVDEAHATLVCGKRGAGATEAFGIEDAVDIHVGTLSKSIGAQGGFVTTGSLLHKFLVTHARTHVYSTTLAAPILTAALTSINVATRDSTLKEKLWKNVALFSGLMGCQYASHIAPILVGEEEQALSISKRLFKEGFHVTAIRPPTVPPGTSRLRVSISAAHTEDQIKGLVRALKRTGVDIQASANFFRYQDICPELLAEVSRPSGSKL